MRPSDRAAASLFLGLALSLSACAAPTDSGEEDDVGSAADAVVAGNVTYERPEIGAVRRGGGLCTGTLVRPNVVLTAAHCVDGVPKDQPVAESAGYSFEIGSSSTARRRFVVDRVHSFLAPEHFDEAQGWRAHDIAVLRLREDVPSSLARPAAIADRAPRLGGQVAVYGYGCTDRAAGTDGRRPGAGAKRKKAYRWSLGLALGFSDTNNLCPGDSGGPLLDVERNAVFGTNSGFSAGGDVFGDVPADHAEVSRIVSSWWPRR